MDLTGMTSPSGGIPWDRTGYDTSLRINTSTNSRDLPPLIKALVGYELGGAEGGCGHVSKQTHIDATHPSSVLVAMCIHTTLPPLFSIDGTCQYGFSCPLPLRLGGRYSSILPLSFPYNTCI